MFSSTLKKVLVEGYATTINGGGGRFPNFVSTLHCSSAAQKKPDKFHVPLPRQHDWNRAVASAEKLVGFPTSAIHLRKLLTDDVTGMTNHL